MSGPSRSRFFALTGIFILALSAGAIAPKIATAAPSETAPKPMAPSIAPTIRKIPENPFRCDRQIRYQGKTLSCDSALRRDGESLRTIVQDTPSALEELDRYQDGRKSIKFAAFTGTAGVLMVVGSSMIADLLISADKGDQRTKTARILRYSGGGIVLGSVIYGLSRLRSNEDHLNQTVINFNAAHPDHPIEFLFKTEF